MANARDYQIASGEQNLPEHNAHKNAHSDHLISEGLLSISKDNRYIQQCQQLLLNTLEQIVGSANLSETAETGTWYASCLLYLYIVAAKSNRTLGMESTGLKFAETFHRTLVFTSLWILAMSLYCSDYIFSRDSELGNATREALRGTDRRRMHERLRLQMLQRSAQQSTATSEGQRSQQTNLKRRNFLKSVVSIANDIFKAIFGPSAHIEGPHTFRNSQTVNATFSLLSWVIRLHLAQYCVTGKFPSILHRVLELKHEIAEKRIRFTPGTTHYIGLLIGSQAMAVATRNVSNWLAQKVAHMIYFRKTNNGMDKPNDLQHFFQDEKESPLSSTANIAPKTGNSCAICRAKRIHAAASSSCGHVFCWNCLIQWVTTVRPECPLCRSKCKAQDVLPLYNYDGGS